MSNDGKEGTELSNPSTSKGNVEESVSSRPSSCSKTSASPEASASRPPGEDQQNLRLASPVGGDTLFFKWPLRELAGYSEGQEIIDVVRNTLSSFPELNFIVHQRCGLSLDTVDKKDFQQMTNLLEAFNRACPTITQLWKGATKPGGEIWSAERADATLLRQICTRAYNRAVDNVHLLNNHYKAFSSQTYGETSFERMQMIIQEIVPKERDVFVDLGSGVGQLVIQMAGGSRVKKAVGIEIASLPNRYAQNLSVEFKKWMKWYGKKFRPFELHKGDFLDEKYRELITKEATIILINNYAFTAELETRIKRELLSELKEGTRIISTKPYGIPNRTNITDRHLNDISAILDIYEMSECKNACSWTSNYVAYYHHTINRTRLEKYFLTHRNPSLRPSGNGSDGSRRSSTSSKASRESGRCWSCESSASLPNSCSTIPGRRAATPILQGSHTPVANRGATPAAIVKHERQAASASDDDEEYAVGPTTRRKWQEYCSTKTKSAASISSDNASSAGRSAKWPTPDCDHSPPKKARKIGQRGRPRKAPGAKTVAEETQGTIDMMHQMTRTVTNRPVATPLGDNQETDSKDVPEAPITQIVHQSKYPALNQMLETLRVMFEAQLEKMGAAGFAEEIKEQIEIQKAYQTHLQSQKDAVTKQIAQLLASGMRNFYLRLEEIGITANTPALVIESAKEIVAHHKRITAECAAVESEITALELSNQQLEAKVRRREDADVNNANSSGILPNGQGQLMNSLCANQMLLADNMSAAHKHLLSRLVQLTDQVSAADGNINVGMGESGSHNNGLLSPSSDTSNPVLTFSSAPAGYGHPVSTHVPSVTSLSAGNTPLKRSRQRQARGQVTSKKFASSNTKQTNDPKEDEEMERKIQDIVAKALEVDSAAKCAEKERRARGEKRKEKSSSTVTLSNRSSDDATLSLHPTNLPEKHLIVASSNISTTDRGGSTDVQDSNITAVTTVTVSTTIPITTASSTTPTMTTTTTTTTSGASKTVDCVEISRSGDQ